MENISALVTERVNKSDMIYDMIVSSGFFPRITLPTRISNSSATLIDNFLCKITKHSSNSIAGILLTSLSDHFPYFISLAYSKSGKRTDKYIEVKQTSHVSINNFKSEIANSDIYSKMNKDIDSDPNINYDIIHNILKSATKQHLAPKIVKFNKRRHKKSQWITQGIVKSISYRDKLYKQYRTTPTNADACDRIKINLNTYNKILKSNIRLAKRNHFYSLFEKYKCNIKNTWTNIKDLLQQSKVKRDFSNHFTINGEEITDSNIIANKFCKYFTDIGPSLAKNIKMPKTLTVKIF